MNHKGFYIEQVKVTGEGKKDAVIDFIDGVNVILAPSNSGKSLIMECIYYCFGYIFKESSKQKKGTDYSEKIKALDGYTAVSVTIKTANGHYEIVRAINDDDHVLINGKPYYMNGRKGDTPKLDEFLLGLLGIHGEHYIRSKRKSSASPNRVTFRSLLSHFYVRQGKVTTEQSVFFNPADPSTHITALSLFLFLLNGNNCDEFKKNEDPKVKNARSEGEKNYIEKQLSALGPRSDKLTAQITEMVPFISENDELDKQVKEIQKQIDAAIAESHRIMNEIYEKNSKLSEANTIKEQFKALKSQYDSDIRRMSLILKSEESIQKYPAKDVCPICGQPIKTENHSHEYSTAITAESKLKKDKIADLQAAQADLTKKQEKIRKEIASLEARHKQIEDRLNQELFPKIQNLKDKIERRRKFDQLKAELDFVNEQLENLRNDLDKNQTQEKPKDEIYHIEDEFTDDTIRKFRVCLQDLLTTIHFPNAASAFWNMDTFDVSFGDKSKTAMMGGGFCAIINACVLIAYEQLLIHSGKYVPGCVFIDSPLTSLSESQYIEEKDTMQHYFAKYLMEGETDGQIIIAEHPERFTSIRENSHVKIISYSHDKDHGIYGFIPDMCK